MSALTIRTVHHLSATGGTLISKAIAALPNVYLLSELHPRTTRTVHFNPIDPFQQFCAQYGVEFEIVNRDLDMAFMQRLRHVSEMVQAQNGMLVLRDHAHSDWLVPSPSQTPTLLNLLKTEFPVTSVVTLRNPVESFLAMRENGWHKGVSHFDAFCGRVLRFLDTYAGTPMFHYEDFVRAPDKTLQEIADSLDLPYDPAWQLHYLDRRLTGDSGRGSESGEIRPLPMRDITVRFRDNVMASANYRALCDRCGYDVDPRDQMYRRNEEARLHH